MNKPIYRVFPNVIPVLGYQKGILYDLFRGDSFMLPKDLIELLISHKELQKEKLIKLYGEDNTETILEYIDFLVDRKLVFVTNSHVSSCTPPFNLEWDSPSTLTNAQIAISDSTNLETLKVALSELHQLGCKALGVIIEEMPLSNILNFLSFVDSSYCFNLEVSIDYRHNSNQSLLIQQAESLNKLVVVNICDAANNSLLKSTKYHHLTLQYHTTAQGDMPCSMPCKQSFNCGMTFFCEAKSFNSCLNRKLSIDSNGKVRNCIASNKSFGSIEKLRIIDILNTSNLAEAWNITKDQIDVCKDCEFRYMCTDCRVFIKDPENIYSQPAKCTYNPYIAKWQGEEGYVPVEECGTYKRETGFVVNQERVAELNMQLWGG